MIIYATIINAPFSTRNSGKARGPERHHSDKEEPVDFAMAERPTRLKPLCFRCETKRRTVRFPVEADRHPI